METAAGLARELLAIDLPDLWLGPEEPGTHGLRPLCVNTGDGRAAGLGLWHPDSPVVLAVARLRHAALAGVELARLVSVDND